MTTMELSTSIPMPSARPAMVMMLRDSPEKYISTRAKTTDRGMLMATMRVGLTVLRKRARMMTASRAPISILLIMSRMIISMYSP